MARKFLNSFISGLLIGSFICQPNVAMAVVATPVGGGTTLTDSASLRSALSDETGTGVAVFGTSPTFTTGITTPLVTTNTSGSWSAPTIKLNSENTGFSNPSVSQIAVVAGSAGVCRMMSTGVHFANGTTSSLRWYADTNFSTITGAINLDAANAISFGNSTTAQSVRVYETLTDASNYERFAINTGSNNTTLTTETAGSGTDDLTLTLSASGTSSVIVNTPLSLSASSELTIASGAVTATESYQTIDTEADDASDDLDTINGGSAGDILVIRAENDARTVVVKDGTGNLKLSGDITLDNAEDTLTLISNGTNWYQISSSNNGT